MAAIQTTGLTKRYGESVLAVDDLDLTVEEGEIFGFLGPNGAGKSTTINMLLDFVRPTDGSATVLGHDAQEETGAIRERIGVLPEGATLYERLTAREHVEWVADTKGVTEEIDVDAILERVGILEDADRTAGGFSKGMRQRLGLGMALVGDPDLLLLDEPSSGLDPTGIQDMRELLRSEAESGTTVFFSSHILSEVEAVCDRVGIMNEGRLVALDSIENLRDEATGTSTIDVDLADGADPVADDVESIEGVQRVTVEDGTVTAVCDDPSVKVDVVRRLDQRATVTDILSTDTSLEELFNRYTGTESVADAIATEESGDREAEVTA